MNKAVSITLAVAFLAIGSTMAQANKGTVIVEPYECKTELLNYKELQQRVKNTSKDDWKYQIFVKDLRLTLKGLTAHGCKLLD